LRLCLASWYIAGASAALACEKEEKCNREVAWQLALALGLTHMAAAAGYQLKAKKYGKRRKEEEKSKKRNEESKLCTKRQQKLHVALLLACFERRREGETVQHITASAFHGARRQAAIETSGKLWQLSMAKSAGWLAGGGGAGHQPAGVIISWRLAWPRKSHASHQKKRKNHLWAWLVCTAGMWQL